MFMSKPAIISDLHLHGTTLAYVFTPVQIRTYVHV